MNSELTAWASRVLNIPIEEAPTKALSFRQPWCEFILNPAIGKDEENRVWTSKFEGWVFMHASQYMHGLLHGLYHYEAFKFATRALNWNMSDLMAITEPCGGGNHGGIVGAIRIGKSRVVHTKWAMEGQQQIPILEARRLPFIPCKGSQRWFIPQCQPPTA